MEITPLKPKKEPKVFFDILSVSELGFKFVAKDKGRKIIISFEHLMK